MELKVTTLEGKAAVSVQLSDAIFGLEPRKDIIQRCVNWQLAKRQAVTHKTQGRADVWRTGKKMYKQKGTGGARHGSARVPQFRGGGKLCGSSSKSAALLPLLTGITTVTWLPVPAGLGKALRAPMLRVMGETTLTAVETLSLVCTSAPETASWPAAEPCSSLVPVPMAE